MSAATARRNYASTGGGSSTQTITAPPSLHHHHQQQQQQQQYHHHQQLYPTPLSSTGTVASTSTSSRSGGGQTTATGNMNSSRTAQVGGMAYAQYPTLPMKTAGESWSMQKEGDKNVIVIEDTPPPTAGGSTSRRPSHETKKARTNGYDNTYQVNNNLHYSGIVPSAVPGTSSSAYAPSTYAVPPVPRLPAKKAAPSGKRKYNEVNDPAAASDRLYPPQKALTVDDKDGHYIIRPDDELGDTRRYKIIRLLGQGTFGKVVEAWDRDMRQKCAVKIIRAIQKYRDASKVEIKVLNLLRERDPANSNKCIHLLDCFDHKNHICIVTKLLSCSVFDFLKDNNYLSFPMAHIQSFAKQLLQSVAFLHDLKLVHTDLKPENILLVNNEFGTVPIKPPKNNPQIKMKRVLKDPAVHLIDFGSATFEDEYHASVVSTRHYRAPEIILGLGWSYPCDVWSIGCILVEFFTGEALFQTHENLEHLAMMEVVFGQMPPNRFGKSGVKAKPEWFNGSQTKVNYPLPTTSKQSRKYVKAMRPLETIIPPVNIVHSRFLDLLNHLLKWDPQERYTVREALRHPFFSIDINDEEVNQIR